MSSTDWPRCQGGTPNRYSGSARAISPVNALAAQMSTTAIRRSVVRMPLSWCNQSADVCIACSQRMTRVLLLLAKSLLYHENRAKGKAKVCGRPRRIHSLNYDFICDFACVKYFHLKNGNAASGGFSRDH